jgi:hypothetical protein
MTFGSLLDGRRLVFAVVMLVSLALLGHVCASPIASVWEPDAAAEPHSANESDVASCDASCEAAASRPASHGPRTTARLAVVLSDGDDAAEVAPHRGDLRPAVAAPQRSPDRPLFLLSAALLI